MRKQNLKRLEALERAAEKKIFARAPTFSYAIASFLGDSKHVSDVHAYARALGYQDRAELCQALEETRSEPLMTLTRPSGLTARTVRARRKLLAKFGFDLGRASPATLADALYRIAKTLPEEWRAAIVSGEKKRREAEVLADRILKDLDQLSEQEEDPASMSAGQTAPRRPHRGKRRHGDPIAQKGTQETLELSSSRRAAHEPRD